jgi:hypothetical protein
MNTLHTYCKWVRITEVPLYLQLNHTKAVHIWLQNRQSSVVNYFLEYFNAFFIRILHPLLFLFST